MVYVPRAVSTTSCSGSSMPGFMPVRHEPHRRQGLLHEAWARRRSPASSISAGGGLDHADNCCTALMIAAELGAAGVRSILQRGADRARKDKEGKTALSIWATKPDVREVFPAAK